MVWTTDDEDEDEDPNILPALSPFPVLETFPPSQHLSRETGDMNIGTDVESHQDGTLPEPCSEWSNIRPISDPTSSSASSSAVLLPIAPYSSEPAVEGSAFDGLEGGSTSQSNHERDQVYPTHDPPSCAWCWQVIHSLQLPEYASTFPIPIRSDSVDEELSNNVDSAASLPSDSEPVIRTRDATDSDVGCQETLVVEPAQVEVSNAEEQQRASATDSRSRVVGNPLVRGNVASRCMRGRIGGGGKTTLGEKAVGDEAAPGEGFMTDGRGRVIGTSEEVVWQGEEFQDSETLSDHGGV